MSERRIIKDDLILYSIDYSYNTGECSIYKNVHFLMWAESYWIALGHCLMKYPESNKDDFEILKLYILVLRYIALWEKVHKQIYDNLLSGNYLSILRIYTNWINYEI